MKKRLILVAIISCLLILLSVSTVFAAAITLPEEQPQPQSGPPGTLVTWAFTTPFDTEQGPPYDGFIPGENGDIFFCDQQIDVGNFTVANILVIAAATFNVPEQATPGSCTVRAHGRESGFEVTADFNVQATAVPYTGGPAKKTLPSWIAYLTGGIMLAVGGVFVWRRTLAP